MDSFPEETKQPTVGEEITPFGVHVRNFIEGIEEQLENVQYPGSLATLENLYCENRDRLEDLEDEVLVDIADFSILHSTLKSEIKKAGPEEQKVPKTQADKQDQPSSATRSIPQHTMRKVLEDSVEKTLHYLKEG